MGIFTPRKAGERPVPGCCGYCQSREIKEHCPNSVVPGANCPWVRCRKCGAISGYAKTNAEYRATHGHAGLEWRLVYTKGQRDGYTPDGARPG